MAPVVPRRCGPASSPPSPALTLSTYGQTPSPAGRKASDKIEQTIERGQVERDPLARRLDAAPLDDEPLTADDLEAIEEAREDFAAGRFVSLEELRRELEWSWCVQVMAV